jgi:hypothetical protein
MLATFFSVGMRRKIQPFLTKKLSEIKKVNNLKSSLDIQVALTFMLISSKGWGEKHDDDKGIFDKDWNSEKYAPFL